jgi:diguanylate cyclase (GGDEF)-like protein
VSELKATRDRLARLASTDALTGVYSRRWWFDLAEKEFSRSCRYDRVFSLLMAGSRPVQTINDTYGHEAGDRVLNQFGTMLRKTCRDSDVIGRLGGEEFALLLPETPCRGRAAPGEPHHRSLPLIVINESADDVRCSCSLGVTEVRPDDERLDNVLTRADQALYAAKRAGRDRGASRRNVGRYQGGSVIVHEFLHIAVVRGQQLGSAALEQDAAVVENHEVRVFARLRRIRRNDVQFLSAAHCLVRGHIERVANLVGDDDRRHRFEISQLHDLIVDRDGRDRIEARWSGRRAAADAASTPSRERSRRGAVARPESSDGIAVDVLARPTNPSTSSTRRCASCSGRCISSSSR